MCAPVIWHAITLGARCRGDFGRLGHGDCGDVFLPKPVAALSDKRVVACSCGDTHTLCVTSDGLLYSFGRNSNGQLGNGRTDDNTTPAVVQALQVRTKRRLA